MASSASFSKHLLSSAAADPTSSLTGLRVETAQEALRGKVLVTIMNVVH